MATRIKTRRTCPKGHIYYKNTDCPTCPVCEKNHMIYRPENFLTFLSAPARRGLENQGIDTLEKLSALTKVELLRIHGVGPASLPKLQQALSEVKLKFQESPGK